MTEILAKWLHQENLKILNWHSLNPENLILMLHSYPDREGATFSARYNPSLRQL